MNRSQALPSHGNGGDGADLDIDLDRLAQLVQIIKAECRRAGPQGISAVLASNRPQLYAAMSAVGGWINEFLAAQPSDDEVRAAKARIVPLIRDWSRTGQFFQRVYERLHDSPAAFDAAEIIYSAQPAGGNLSALIFDDYFLHINQVCAVRNRLAYLVECLGEEIRACIAAGAKRVRILSLSNGSMRELILLADDPLFSTEMAVTCLDSDPAALRYARRHLAGRLQGRVTCLRVNPLQFARRPDRPSQPYHVIYSAGLFNSLRDDQAAELVQDSHTMLMPGGRLILGNFCAQLPANERVLSEWVLDWHAFLRDAADLRRIFAGTLFRSDALQVAYEPLHGYVFALARRTTDGV